jgi:hypothetical protein
MFGDAAEEADQWRLDALGPAPRAELLHVLLLPNFTAPTGSAPTGGPSQDPHFRELLIDCEEDRAVLVGILRETG